MQVKGWEISEQTDTVEVSAEIDGFRLWYRLPRSYPVTRAGDPFLAAALLPAMLRGEKLEVDPRLPVSPKLLKNLAVLQEIHHSWNPVLKIIPVSAQTSASRPLRQGAMSFFSGGVDSTYTLLKRIEEISHIVFIQGFDFFAGRGQDLPFSVADISDLAQIACKLDAASDVVSVFVMSALSESTRQALSRYRDSGSDPGALEKALAADLGKIIAGPSVYRDERFAGIRLRPETRRLLERALEGESPDRLNRLLLEDAYPLEIAREKSEVYPTAIERNASFARGLGKTLIPVETNHFPFGYRYNLSRNLSQGGALASVALLLGFPRVFVPSSYSYSQLFPLGSHPLTDPLWANEGMEISHDGSEARRVDKVMRIAEDGHVLANLRVCFHDMNVNCGKCQKCLRTMIPLKLLQAGTGPFPPLPPTEVIRKMRIAGDIELNFFQDNLDLALKSGDDELRDALQSCLARYERQRLFKEADRVILRGLVRRVLRARANAAEGIQRIDTTPPSD
jgi:hypothetical protein